MVFVAGCKKTSGTGAAKEDLALVPKESQIVFMGNVARMRNTAMWRKLLDYRDGNPAAKQKFDDLTKRYGFDPLKEIDSFFGAFPGAVSDEKEFALLVRGTFNKDNIEKALSQVAKDEGHPLVMSDHGGKKLYTDAQGELFGSFLDPKSILLGGKQWSGRVIDIADGKEQGSAKENPDLTTYFKRVKTSDAFWAVGLVPQTQRDQMKGDARLSALSGMKAVFGSFDLASGLTADLNVELGSEQEAKDLATLASTQLTDARKNPQIMLLGFGGVFDGVKIDSKGPTLHVAINFNQKQVDDLSHSIEALLSSFGAGALGQMGGGPPSGMASPGMAPPGMAPTGIAPPGMAPMGIAPPGLAPSGVPSPTAPTADPKNGGMVPKLHAPTL